MEIAQFAFNRKVPESNRCYVTIIEHIHRSPVCYIEIDQLSNSCILGEDVVLPGPTALVVNIIENDTVSHADWTPITFNMLSSASFWR